MSAITISGLDAHILLFALDIYLDTDAAGKVTAHRGHGMAEVQVLRDKLFAAHEHPEDMLYCHYCGVPVLEGETECPACAKIANPFPKAIKEVNEFYDRFSPQQIKKDWMQTAIDTRLKQMMGQEIKVEESPTNWLEWARKADYHWFFDDEWTYQECEDFTQGYCFSVEEM